MTNNQDILLQVLERGPANSRQIVSATGLSKRAVSVGIGKLIEGGYAQRSEDGTIRKTGKRKDSSSS